MTTQRLRDLGCALVTAESLVFDLLGTAKHPRFKDVSELVKARAGSLGTRPGAGDLARF